MIPDYLFWRLVIALNCFNLFFFSSRRRHTRLVGDWSSDVCSSDLLFGAALRWPIRRKGIGFFLVHLGLLLSLGGAAVSSTLAVRGRLDLLAGGDVATHVMATRGGVPTGEIRPLGFELKLDKFKLVNYESEYRLGYYEQRPVKDEDGHVVEQWRLKTSFEPDTRRHLLPGGDTFQIEAIYPDFVKVASATPVEGGAPALEVTLA